MYLDSRMFKHLYWKTRQQFNSILLITVPYLAAGVCFYCTVHPVRFYESAVRFNTHWVLCILRCVCGCTGLQRVWMNSWSIHSEAGRSQWTESALPALSDELTLIWCGLMFTHTPLSLVSLSGLFVLDFAPPLTCKIKWNWSFADFSSWIMESPGICHLWF